MVFNGIRSNAVMVNGVYNAQRWVLAFIGDTACDLVCNARDFLREFPVVRSSELCRRSLGVQESLCLVKLCKTCRLKLFSSASGGYDLPRRPCRA
jgi:hypothetical protein